MNLISMANYPNMSLEKTNRDIIISCAKIEPLGKKFMLTLATEVKAYTFLYDNELDELPYSLGVFNSEGDEIFFYTKEDGIGECGARFFLDEVEPILRELLQVNGLPVADAK